MGVDGEFIRVVDIDIELFGLLPKTKLSVPVEMSTWAYMGSSVFDAIKKTCRKIYDSSEDFIVVFYLTEETYKAAFLEYQTGWLGNETGDLEKDDDYNVVDFSKAGSWYAVFTW